MERPTIKVVPGRRPWMVDEAGRAVAKNAEFWGIFQREGILMRTVTLSAEEVEQDKRLRRPPGAVVLQRVTTPVLEDVFGRAAHWVNMKDADCDCPPKVALIFLSREGAWPLPHLRGVIEAPILRADGTILTTQGYDRETGLFTQSSVEWPALPAPSLAAALAAVKCLTAPFLEFPFSTPAGWSVLISAILTGIQRRLLFSAPAHAFDAPARSSGKSLLADCVSRIVVGRDATGMSFNPSPEEFRKKLFAGLLGGDLIINVDNVTKNLESDTFASILTSEKHTDRILGVSANRAVPTNCLFLVTGNNMQFSGDMPTRVIIARIEPNCERPEERTFEIANLRAHVLERRPQLVTAALTILQSYFFAGRPAQGLKPFGRFEQWSDEIRSAVVWAGLPDPCMTRDDIISTDPERESTLAVLENWSRVVGAGKFTLQALVQKAADDADLRAALLEVAADLDRTGQINSRRLAAWVRTRVGRVVGRYKLARAGAAHGGFKTWQVVDVNKSEVEKALPTLSDLRYRPALQSLARLTLLVDRTYEFLKGRESLLNDAGELSSSIDTFGRLVDSQAALLKSLGLMPTSVLPDGSAASLDAVFERIGRAKRTRESGSDNGRITARAE
jgi:putative DNA primase/helicase